MKTLIIIILILLVAGLYFAPEITKKLVKTTGHAVLNASKEGFEQIKEIETYKNATELIKNKVSDIIVVEH